MDTRLRLTLAASFSAIALAACGPRDEDQPKKPDQGRAETRGISAVDAVGYSGTPVRRKLDKALDANDQHKDQLDQAIDQQSQ